MYYVFKIVFLEKSKVKAMYLLTQLFLRDTHACIYTSITYNTKQGAVK